MFVLTNLFFVEMNEIIVDQNRNRIHNQELISRVFLFVQRTQAATNFAYNLNHNNCRTTISNNNNNNNNNTTTNNNKLGFYCCVHNLF